MIKTIMRTIIVGLCISLGSIGFAANQYLPGSSLSLQTQINNAAASGTKLVIPGGTYSVSGLTCATGVVIESDGPVAFNLGSSNGLSIPSGCSMTLRGDFEFYGNAPAYTGYGTGPSSGSQFGISAINPNDLKIEGRIKIHNINGTCFDAQQVANWQNRSEVDITVFNCYRGAWLHNGAEYMTLNVFAFNNVIGVQDDGANNRITGSAIFNSIGYKICGSNDLYCNNIGNNGHGILTGVHANHNTFNLSFQNITLGYTVSGSHAIGDQSGGNSGTIQLVNAKGVNIVGGQIGSNITVDAASQVMVQGNYVRTDLPGYAAPAAPSGGTFGTFFGKNNFGPTGMWASNN
jgi:hypothetical protein